MRNKFTPISFIAGIVLGVSVVVGGVTMASGLDSIKFIVNGIDRTPKDNIFNNNGTPVEASFIRNGTTYVPIRLVSNLLDVPISWDGASRSIFIGKQPPGSSYLSDRDPYYSAGGYILNNDQTRVKEPWNYNPRFSMKIAGKEYAKGISIDGYGRTEFRVDYNLKGESSSFSCLVGLDDSAQKHAMKLTVLGDGRALWEGILSPGETPKGINVTTSGVHQFTFKMTLTEAYGTILDIVDPVLKN